MNETSEVSSVTARKYLTAKEKFAIIKEQLTTKTGVTEICRKYGISASQFYRWQELFFEGAASGLESAKRGNQSSGELAQAHRQIEERQREVDRLREVILEIAAENVQLKKSPGVLSTIR